MKRKMLKGHGIEMCRWCGSETPLWSQERGACDVCQKALHAKKGLADGVYREEAEALADFARCAKEIWPGLKTERVQQCWSGLQITQ